MEVTNKQVRRLCLWCKQSNQETSFNKKAHTIPKSLGGQNYNLNVCDSCNHFFGNATPEVRYSIETALKETFCISRQRFLMYGSPKRQVGNFKSIFFDVKERNGKLRLVIKKTFLFNAEFQKKLCINFKKGLIKMWFEEFDRQSKNDIGCNEKFDMIRQFCRYDKGNLPVLYFERKYGILLVTKTEAETPKLILNRMKYLYNDDKFAEIEFLGHVFGFPIANFSVNDFENYMKDSLKLKENLFLSAVVVDRLIDIDFALTIMNN